MADELCSLEAELGKEEEDIHLWTMEGCREGSAPLGERGSEMVSGQSFFASRIPLKDPKSRPQGTVLCLKTTPH